jgi:hypothetical protein
METLLGAGASDSQSLPQLPHCQAADRILHLPGDLCQRREDEGAVAKPRVRHPQSGLVDDRSAIQHQVEVERPRSSVERTIAAALRLERQQDSEQLLSREVREARRGPVQEDGLLADADRIGINEGGNTELGEEGTEVIDSEREMRGSIPQVAAKGDRDAWHRLSRRASGLP